MFNNMRTYPMGSAPIWSRLVDRFGWVQRLNAHGNRDDYKLSPAFASRRSLINILTDLKIYIIAVMLFLFVNSNIVSADEFEIDHSKAIVRQIVTKIEWDDFDKRIVVHKIVIQKDEMGIQTYPTENVIYVESLEEQTLTDVQAEEFVREYSANEFNSDFIFGHTVEVFKDLSGNHNISQEEIDKWVKLAQQQVEKDYLSPPEFKDSGISDGWHTFFSYLIIIIVIALILLVPCLMIIRAVRSLIKKL